MLLLSRSATSHKVNLMTKRILESKTLEKEARERLRTSPLRLGKTQFAEGKPTYGNSQSQPNTSGS
jgi:DNA-binding TFAR19-related protein (PDSD5 family)